MHLFLAIYISSFLQIFVLVSFAKNSEYLRLATAKLYPQKHNTLSPGRVRTQSARSGVERTNHEATAPLTFNRLRSNF